MKYLDIYTRMDLKSQDDVFNYLIATLKPSNRTWSYLTNWGKVSLNIKQVEVSLNILNYLIGKPNVETEFRLLAKRHPEILRTLPLIVAYRENNLSLLTDYRLREVDFKHFNFKKLSVEEAVEFCEGAGIFGLLRSNLIKNFVDFVMGVEVGIDSNGRKNRSGKAMETLVEHYVKPICKKCELPYITQATAKKIKEAWNIDIEVDKTDRIIDFVILVGDKLYMLETNYYSGTGSKLKSTAGEYETLYDTWSKAGYGFIWITDGLGWQKTQNPLRETFDHIEHLLNLQMIKDGVLEQILVNGL